MKAISLLVAIVAMAAICGCSRSQSPTETTLDIGRGGGGRITINIENQMLLIDDNSGHRNVKLPPLADVRKFSILDGRVKLYSSDRCTIYDIEKRAFSEATETIKSNAQPENALDSK